MSWGEWTYEFCQCLLTVVIVGVEYSCCSKADVYNYIDSWVEAWKYYTANIITYYVALAQIVNFNWYLVAEFTHLLIFSDGFACN